MPPPSDEELLAAMADDYEAQERSKRNREAMNRLLRGHRQVDDDGEPADMNAAIRKAAGRAYKTKTTEEDES